MGDAEHGVVTSDVALLTDVEVERVAEAYIAVATGDVRAALTLSVTDGMAAARLVSRGFARWGRTERSAIPSVFATWSIRRAREPGP